MSISVCSRLIRYSLMEKLVCSNQWNISEFLRPKIIVKLDFTTSNIRNELFSRWDLDLPYQCHLYTEWHPVKLLRQIHINEVNSFCVHGNVSCVKKTLQNHPCANLVQRWECVIWRKLHVCITLRRRDVHAITDFEMAMKYTDSRKEKYVRFEGI